MKITRRLAGVLAAAVTVGAVLAAGTIPAQAAAAAPGRTAPTTQAAYMGRHLEAALHGGSRYPAVRGHASYMSSWRRELGVSIWNARRLAGHRVIVYVHGTRVGSMTCGVTARLTCTGTGESPPSPPARGS